MTKSMWPSEKSPRWLFCSFYCQYEALLVYQSSSQKGIH